MAARATIYTSYVQLMPSMDGFFQAVDREMAKVGKRMNKVGKTYAKNFSNGFKGLDRSISRTLNAGLSASGGVAGASGGRAGRSYSSAFGNGVRGIGRGFGAVLSPLMSPIADAGRRGGYSFAFNFTNMAKFMIKRAAVGLSLAAVGALPAQVVGGGISRALGIENAEAQLKGLGYSLEQIKGVSQSALKAVEGTIFSLDQSVKVASTALAAGVGEGADLENYIKLVGDAATIAGTDLSEMGTIFNKIKANGKVWSQELNMIADRGIPIFSWMATEMGVTQDAFRKMVEDGEVQADVFLKVMNDKVAGAALAGADTTTGAFRNMRIAMSRLGAATLGKFLPTFKVLFLAIRDVTDAVSKRLAPAFDAFLQKFGGPIADKINLIKDSLVGVFNVSSEGGWVKALETNFWKAIDAFKSVKETFSSINPFGNFSAALEGMDLGGKIQSGFDWLLNTMKRLAPVVATALGYLANGLTSALPYLERFASSAGGLIEKVIGKFENADFGAIYYKISDFVAFFESKVWPTLAVIGTSIYAIFSTLGTAIGTYFAGNQALISGYIGNIVTAMMGLLPIIQGIIPHIIIIAGAFAALVMAVAPLIPQVVAIVGALAGALAPILSTLATLIGDNIGLILGIAGAIGTYLAVTKIATAITAAWNAIVGFSQTVALASMYAWGGLTGVLTGKITVLGLATGAWRALSVAIAANPIGLIATVLAVIIGALITWITTTDEGKAAWDGFVGFIVDSVKWLGDVLNGFFGWIGEMFGALGEWWDGLFSDKEINVKSNVDHTSNNAKFAVPALGTGGNVMSPTVALVGEKRPETVTDLGLTNRFIKNTNRLVEDVRENSIGGRGDIINIEIQAGEISDPTELARIMAKELRKQRRR